MEPETRLQAAYRKLEEVSTRTPSNGTEKRAQKAQMTLAIIELDAAAKEEAANIDAQASEDKAALRESVKAAKARAGR